MAWQRYRTIVEAAEVTAYLQRETARHRRLGEAWDGLKWLLAHKSDELGLHKVASTTEYRLYRQAGDMLARTPDITVLFSTSDTEVIIHGVRVTAREEH